MDDSTNSREKLNNPELEEFRRAARELGRELLRVVEPLVLPILRWIARVIG